MKKVLFLIAFGFLGSLHAQGLLNNLRGCYPLHCDGAVNSATTGTSLDGQLFSVTCATGHLNTANTAYQFAGNPNSFIDINNGAPLQANVMSISGWFYINSNTSQCMLMTESGCANHTEAYAIRTEWNGTQLKFLGRKGGNLCQVNNVVNVYSAPITINAWYHVVFYFDNNVAKLWVNNVSTTVNHSIPAYYITTAPVRLGYETTGVGTFFSGKMEDLRFYDRLLTAAEITQLSDPSQDVSCNAPGSGGSGGSGNGACCLGNLCSATQNPLTGNYEVPLNSFDFNFTDAQNSTAKINMGNSTCNFQGTARLNVSDDNLGYAIIGSSRTFGAKNIGVNGYAVDMNSNSAATTFGVLGESIAAGGNVLASTAGVAGFCGGNSINTMPLGEQIGVYGNSVANGGQWAGYFDGDVKVVGKVWGSQYNWVSDKRFKTNIIELTGVTEKLNQLKGYTYEFKTEEFKSKNFPKGEQLGLIAQELKEVFPQLVSEDKQGYLAVNYMGLIPVLIEANKEQQSQMEAQKESIKIQQEQIDELKILVNSLINNSSNKTTNPNSVSVNLNDKNTIVLNQNIPNPFAETTLINYIIPNDFGKAQIIFSTNDGKIIKVVEIAEHGAGSLNVFANDLTNGIYTYALVIDGKTIDTKKMIKQ
ncbi:MAG: tail fiber domain-containing protein [Bacteroidia bacterium]|nr:tail fiber domain-containing protein [Bacteroidia bacterium]